MVLRVTVAAVVLASSACLPLAGAALAQGDRDCPDFATQEQAQSALQPGDPERLDGDDDGIACENRPASGGSSTSDQLDGSSSGISGTGQDGAAPPSGGVEAGHGGMAQDGVGPAWPWVLFVGGAAVAGSGAVMIRAAGRAR